MSICSGSIIIAPLQAFWKNLNRRKLYWIIPAFIILLVGLFIGLGHLIV